MIEQFYEMRFQTEEGRESNGLLKVTRRNTMVKFTARLDEPVFPHNGASRDILSVKIQDWERRQDDVNRKLRRRGVLWRRSKPETKYPPRK